MKPRLNLRVALRQHRLRRGDLTQEDLAAQVGTTRQTILAIEKGNYNPSVGLALALAAALGVTVEDLFQLDDGGCDD